MFPPGAIWVVGPWFDGIESRTGIRSFYICSASVGYLMRIFVARSVEVHGLYTKAELGEQREAKDGNELRIW